MKDKQKSNSIFKNSKIICDQINLIPFNNKIKLEFNNHYLKNSILNDNLNSDSKLIYYIIMNFHRLVDYNELPTIQTELAYLIIRLINFSFELYFNENSFELRKYETILLSDAPYTNEQVRPIGLYQELILGDIEDEVIKEKNYDAEEELNALDIDDYEQDDDIDGNMEALDGDIDV